MRLYFSVFVLMLVWITGCKDKADPDYAKCIQQDVQGDVTGAWLACSNAVYADPNSKSGIAAATKLAAMKPAYDAWKAADNARQAKEAEQQRMLAAAKLIEVRLRVRRSYVSKTPDADCTGKGMPPYFWTYSGGTYSEDSDVALSDGCRPFTGIPWNTDFCCPKDPNL
jgi:hypothetical protein